MLPQKIRFLSGNTLKLIACAFMLIDHIGMIFFPFDTEFRIIGRLAFPIFAYMIAEGARYTRNKTRYLSTIAAIAMIMELVYYFCFGELVLSIFITFSLSITIIYALDHFKKSIFDPDKKAMYKILAGAIVILLTAVAFILSRFFYYDYGILGVMVPVFTSLFMLPENAPERLKKLDTTLTHLITFSIALLALALNTYFIQLWSLPAILLLMLYSGKRGKLKLKYFFYVFYPAHLALLQIIYWIIH